MVYWNNDDSVNDNDYFEDNTDTTLNNNIDNVSIKRASDETYNYRVTIWMSIVIGRQWLLQNHDNSKVETITVMTMIVTTMMT